MSTWAEKITLLVDGALAALGVGEISVVDPAAATAIGNVVTAVAAIGPAENLEAIDISSTDHAVSNPAGACIYCGHSGDIKVDTAGGQTGVTVHVSVDAFILPARVTKVYKIGTSTTDMVALW
jgi:hypothetical protein